MIGRTLARLRHEFTTLLIDVVMLIAFCVAFCAAAPMLFIIAAQLFRLASTGDWHPVPVSEFLAMLGMTSRPDPSGLSDTVIGFVLELPVSLLLLLSALVFFVIGRLLNKVQLRERARFNSSRQKSLIGVIERELGKSQR